MIFMVAWLTSGRGAVPVARLSGGLSRTQGARDLREALALWRGRPLAGVAGSAWLEEQAQRLDLLADEVRRALFDARLAAGEHTELVSGLERMAAEDPLDEQAHGQLMLALYRCGRQADALAVFRRLRAVLAEQLGIDPSPMLRDLETAILRQDQALAAPARLPASLAARPVPVPAQLPSAMPGFAGRAAPAAGHREIPEMRRQLEIAPAGIPGKTLLQQRLQLPAQICADLDFRDTHYRDGLAVRARLVHTLESSAVLDDLLCEPM